MLNRIKSILGIGRGRTVWIITAVLITATVLTVSARTWLSTASAPPNNVSQKEQAVIRLVTSGFSQAEVSGSAGQYRLVMTRPAPNEEVILQLKTQDGELVQEIAMPQGKLDWTTLIELQTGSYTLTVLNRPEWVCTITVQ